MRHVPDQRNFLPHVQSLRALAVGSVLLYHLWPNRLPGGFIGVDVFFTISGFLIVGNLLRESETTGRIRLLRFWSRRMRRLLPAALLVIVTTVVVVLVAVPDTLWPDFLRDAIGSTFYVQNWLLARDAVDYERIGAAASPFQHFWSLSVEEQFYIVTPLALVAAGAVARRRGARPRAVLFGTIAVLSVASLAYSAWYTADNGPAAYFATTTRVWEFGLGALLAFAPVARSKVLGSTAFVGGALVVIGFALVVPGTDGLPGVLALPPVAATVAMLWGGATIVPALARLVSWRPVQFFGDVSYAVYLWHWPPIILVPIVTGSPLGTLDKVVILVATVAVAWVSTTFVEGPIRSPGPRLRVLRRVRGIIVVGALSMVAVSTPAAVGMAVADHRQDVAAADVARAATEPECFGAAFVADPSACASRPSTGAIVPDPVAAVKDDGNDADCWSDPDGSFDLCSFGPRDATIRIGAFGDSHNNMYVSMYRELAERTGWRIDVAGRGGCYLTTVEHRDSPAIQRLCAQWRASLVRHLDDTTYDAVVVTNDRRGHEPTQPGDPVDVAATGYVDAWRPLLDRGTQVIVLRDTPAPIKDVATCVDQHRDDPNRWCSNPRSKALSGREPLLVAAQRAELPVIDLTDLLCDEDRCAAVVGGVMVHRDHGHLTGTFATSLTPVVEARLRPLVEVR